MRTHNRPTVRVAFTLDNRRLLLLIGAGFLVLLGVFVLGVALGVKVSAPATAPTAELPPLAALDDKEVRYEQARERLAAAPAEALPAEAAPPNPEDVREEAAAPVPEPVAVAPPEPAKSEPAKPEAPKPEPAKREPAKPEPAKPEPPKPAAPKVEPAPPPAAAQTTPAPAGQFYAIQISSSPDRQKAESWVKGYTPFDSRKPYIVEGYVEGKGTWYRIKIGRFETQEQAAAYQAIFEARTKVKGTILTLD